MEEQYAQLKQTLEWRKENEERKCNTCGQGKLLKYFKGRIIKNSGKLWISFLRNCIDCYRPIYNASVARSKKKNKYYNKTYIYKRKSKKSGIRSNITTKFVEQILNCPCYYCRASDVEVVLGRKRTELGYVQSNLVPSCTRCEHIKSDMPWEAWQKLIPAIIEIVKSGLFDNWGLKIIKS
jgi:hypothetical protein